MKDKSVYKELFLSTFMISAFTVGGGFVIVPLLRSKFVEEYGWITDEECLNLVALAQAAPGVIAVNAAIILGFRVGGFVGLALALLGTILPPLLIISLIAYFYKAIAHNSYSQMVLTGLQCGATAAIVNAFFDLFTKEVNRKDITSLLLLIAVFVLSYFFETNVMYLMGLSALVGAAFLRKGR